MITTDGYGKELRHNHFPVYRWKSDGYREGDGYRVPAGYRVQHIYFLQVDVILRFGEVFVWVGSGSCRLVCDALALFPFELSKLKNAGWRSTKESDSWRVQRKKVRPRSTTAVLQIGRPFSEKQRVIWILAPLTRRNCSIGNWRKRQPKSAFFFTKL